LTACQLASSWANNKRKLVNFLTETSPEEGTPGQNTGSYSFPQHRSPITSPKKEDSQLPITTTPTQLLAHRFKTYLAEQRNISFQQQYRPANMATESSSQHGGISDPALIK
jgi:hypothetical protein